MRVEIRFLKEDEASDYKELRLSSYLEDPFAFSESYEDEQNRPLVDFEQELIIQGAPPEWFVLGAFIEKDKLIGFVKFRRDLRSKARHKSMIHAMYTDSNYRSHGIGKKLLQELLVRVDRLDGLEQIHLWVLHSDTTAANFYKKCGFESQGMVVKKDLKIKGKYVDSEYMVLHLDT